MQELIKDILKLNYSKISITDYWIIIKLKDQVKRLQILDFLKKHYKNYNIIIETVTGKDYYFENLENIHYFQKNYLNILSYPKFKIMILSK